MTKMHAVGTFDANGNIADIHELRRMRRKKGLCRECGDVKTHKVLFGGMKLTPLTNEFAMNGRCLNCFPLSSTNSNSNSNSNAMNVAARNSNYTTSTAGSNESRLSANQLQHQPQQYNHSTSNVSQMQHQQSTPSTSRLSSACAAPLVVEDPPTNHFNYLTVKKDSYSYKLAQRQQQQQVTRQLSNNSASGSRDIIRSRGGTSSGSGNSFVSFSTKSSNLGDRYSDTDPQNNRAINHRQSQALRSSFFTNDFPEAPAAAQDPFEVLRQAHLDVSSIDLKEEDCIETDRRSTLRISKSMRDITRVMDLYPTQQDVQEESIKALAAVAEKQVHYSLSRSNINEQQAYLNSDISLLVKSLMQAMANVPDSEIVQDFACQSFWALTTKTSIQLMISKFGGLTLIADAMTRHPMHKGIQYKACSALSNLSTNEDILDSLGEGTNAIARILVAIENFDMDETFLLTACGVLANLTVAKGNRKVLVEYPNGLGVLCNMMVAHSKEISLQEQVLKILRNISSGDEMHKEAIHKVEGIEALVMIMRTHPTKVKIQILCCWTLSNLAVSRPLKRVIGDCGALNLIIDAMWEQEQDASIVEWACRALWSLSVDQQNKEHIGNSTGIDAIVNGMNRHIKNTGVQEKGCGALSNLAANCENNKIIITNSEGIDAIKYAMEAHPSHEGVQEKACLALRKLATENTIPLMMSLDVKKSLGHAIECYPGKCMERAQFVIDKMNEFEM